MADQNNNDSDFEVDNEFIEDESWSEDESAAALPKKKKSGGMIVLIGGLVIIGAGAYYAKDMLMPSTDVPAAPATETAQMASNPFAQNNAQNADMGADTGTAMGFDGAQMAPRPENSPQDAASGSIPQPQPVSENDMGMPGDTSDGEMDVFGESSGSGTDFPSDSDFPSDTGFSAGETDSAAISFGSDSDEMGSEMPEFGQPAPATPIEETAPTENMPEMPADMPKNDMAFGEDDIETVSEDDVISRTQRSDRATAVTTSPATDKEAVNSEEIEALNTRIEDLEEELKTLQSLLKNQNTAQLEKQVDKLNEKINTLEADPPQKAPAASTRKAAPAASKSQAQSSATQQATAANWVLRSANKGEAWVSTADSNDMQRITVGDTLTGLGEVRSIEFDRYQGWVVTGTKSKITQ